MAYGIWVPQPVTEPGPSAVKAQSPNHWMARESPKFILELNKLLWWKQTSFYKIRPWFRAINWQRCIKKQLTQSDILFQIKEQRLKKVNQLGQGHTESEHWSSIYKPLLQDCKGWPVTYDLAQKNVLQPEFLSLDSGSRETGTLEMAGGGRGDGSLVA